MNEKREKEGETEEDDRGGRPANARTTTVGIGLLDKEGRKQRRGRKTAGSVVRGREARSLEIIIAATWVMNVAGALFDVRHGRWRGRVTWSVGRTAGN